MCLILYRSIRCSGAIKELFLCHGIELAVYLAIVSALHMIDLLNIDRYFIGFQLTAHRLGNGTFIQGATG